MVGFRSRTPEEHMATIYLGTHLCGAMVGLQLSRSLVDAYGKWADGVLDSLPGELEYEIEQLLQLIEYTQAISLPRYSRIDSALNRIRKCIHLDALWRNRLVRLAALEVMRTALCGKSAMWEILRDIPAGETEEQHRELNALVSAQIETVTALHHRAATAAFQGPTNGRSRGDRQ